MAQRWYVVKTVPKQEHWAVNNLKVLGFGAFWPRFAKVRLRGNKKVLSCRSVFPGYLFVEFDMEFDDWRRINGVYGVRRLMMLGDYVPAVPCGFVENIIRAAANGLIHEEEKIMGFRQGEVLKIVSGPLEGRIGICQMSETGRVSLLLSLLGRETKVIIRCDQVEPATQIM